MKILRKPAPLHLINLRNVGGGAAAKTSRFGKTGLQALAAGIPMMVVARSNKDAGQRGKPGQGEGRRIQLRRISGKVWQTDLEEPVDAGQNGFEGRAALRQVPSGLCHMAP